MAPTGAGRSLIDPALAEPVASRLRARLGTLSLTEHEHQVLAHVIDGDTDSEIAALTGAEVEVAGAEVQP